MVPLLYSGPSQGYGSPLTLAVMGLSEHVAVLNGAGNYRPMVIVCFFQPGLLSHLPVVLIRSQP